MKRIKEILKFLADIYPEPKTALHHQTPFQLLIATILSAQCTDKRVNLITKQLFADYPTVHYMVQLPVKKLEKYIKSAGLWQTKAKNILRTCEIIVTTYQGKVPNKYEDLIKLPGVGRKTANVILANAFGIPKIAVDTHVHRVSNRLNLTNSKTPEQTEKQLMEIIPDNLWNNAHHWFILHGRNTCKARNPDCPNCPIRTYCPSSKSNS